MPDLILTIGDKNLSSWSFRPWFLLTHAGIAFEEDNIKLDRPESRANLKANSPSGLVPVLTYAGVKIWDSLAIMETIADLYPEKKLWPTDPAVRAFARSVTAEMHSSFSNLRTVWPMCFLRDDLSHVTSGGVSQDIARIDALWTMSRREHGGGGDFLFGDFSVADAVFAPVVSRFSTYGPVALSAESQAYMEVMRATPAWAKWREGAIAETAAD